MNKAQLLDRWQNLEAREKKLLLIGAGLGVIFILYHFIWQPVVNKRQRLQEQLYYQQQLLSTLKQQQQQIIQLRATQQQKSTQQVSMRSLEQALSDHQLTSNIKQIRQLNATQVSLSFSHVSFNELMQWLVYKLEKSSVFVLEFNVQQTKTTGLVNAELLLRIGL